MEKGAWLESVGQMIEKQSGARPCLQVTSIIQIIGGIIAIIGWSIMLAEDHGQNGYTDILPGAGIWTGAIVLAAGACGVLATLSHFSMCTRAKTFYANFGLSMCIWGTAAQQIRFGVGVYHESQKQNVPPAVYWAEPGMIESLALMEVIIGAIFFATGVVVICCYAVIHHKLSNERTIKPTNQ